MNKLSVVSTLYFSEKFIHEFCKRVQKEVSKYFDEYEIILVNDGSPDKSIELALDLAAKNSHIKVIDLSRNFGHHKALKTGLEFATGDYIFLIDSDLEEAPELFTTLWEALISNDKYDVAYGLQRKRKGNFSEKITGRIFYKVLNFLLDDFKYPADTLTARVMTKLYVKNLLKFKEVDFDLWSLFIFNGFKSITVECHKNNKKSTTYTLKRKISMAINIIASTSKKPLLYIFYFGFILAFASFTFLSYVVMSKLFFDIRPGWSSIVGLMLLLFGILFIFLGVLGIYMSVIFEETKKRPSYIIKSIYGFKDESVSV